MSAAERSTPKSRGSRQGGLGPRRGRRWNRWGRM
uniref:Uncharacterized protein n=1 Tax=Rhizophora mucronata TaxID=61149 RepID=A0A2P2M0W2_RHIMU